MDIRMLQLGRLGCCHHCGYCGEHHIFRCPAPKEDCKIIDVADAENIAKWAARFARASSKDNLRTGKTLR